MRIRRDIRAGYFALVTITSLTVVIAAFGQATSTTQYAIPANANAALLYDKAAQLLQAESPSNGDLGFPGSLPVSSEWKREEAIAWQTNSDSRLLAHLARPLQQAQWTTDIQLNRLRALANELGDAAVYADLKGDDAQAIDLILDTLHEAELLRNTPQREFMSMAIQSASDIPLLAGPRAILWPTLVAQWTRTIHPQFIYGLVGVGIDALAMSRLEVIASDIHLTKDPNDAQNAQVAAIQSLILQLMNHGSAREEVADASIGEMAIELLNLTPGPILRLDREGRITRTMNRVNSENDFAAVSLAAHLFRFDKNRWPSSLQELIPDYLPQAPIDPFSNGRQTIGYVLIKSGLPGGSDRPLVYSREDVQDGLFFRLDVPEYSWYPDDRSNLPLAQQKHGGQFRDIARWQPAAHFTGPTTQPLP